VNKIWFLTKFTIISQILCITYCTDNFNLLFCFEKIAVNQHQLKINWHTMYNTLIHSCKKPCKKAEFSISCIISFEIILMQRHYFYCLLLLRNNANALHYCHCIALLPLHCIIAIALLLQVLPR
jgi:hypothetical protein